MPHFAGDADGIPGELATEGWFLSVESTQFKGEIWSGDIQTKALGFCIKWCLLFAAIVVFFRMPSLPQSKVFCTGVAST